MTLTEAQEVIRRGHRVAGNTYPHKEAIRAAGCAWHPETKSWYAPDAATRAKVQAVVDGTMYNSPPPPDLVGDQSPASLASKYGRTAVAGAKPVTITTYGLGRGDEGKPNGSIRIVKGVRYVQVSRTRRAYASREWLEDMDMFGTPAGGTYSWVGVAVEATADEIAAVTAAAAAKAAAEAEREAQIADVLSGKTPVQAHYYDGDYLSGWQASSVEGGKMLEKLGLARWVDGWGYRVTDERVIARLRETQS